MAARIYIQFEMTNFTSQVLVHEKISNFGMGGGEWQVIEMIVVRF